jgi:hypothetical protein
VFACFPFFCLVGLVASCHVALHFCLQVDVPDLDVPVLAFVPSARVGSNRTLEAIASTQD